MAKQALKTSIGPAPNEQEIAQRAYEIYMESGRVPGRDLENWLQAERELSAKPAAKPERMVARGGSRSAMRTAAVTSN